MKIYNKKIYNLCSQLVQSCYNTLFLATNASIAIQDINYRNLHDIKVSFENLIYDFGKYYPYTNNMIKLFSSIYSDYEPKKYEDLFKYLKKENSKIKTIVDKLSDESLWKNTDVIYEDLRKSLEEFYNWWNINMVKISFGIRENQLYNYTLIGEHSSRNTQNLYISYIEEGENLVYNYMEDTKFNNYLRVEYPNINMIYNKNKVLRFIEREEEYKSKINKNGYYYEKLIGGK